MSLGSWTYKTQFNNDFKLSSPTGSKIIDKFVLSIDKNGCSYLKKAGSHNLYDFIQSHKDSCDLNSILCHLDNKQVNGLINSYNVKDLLESPIADLSTMPTSLGEMHNLCLEGEQIFNGLPLEVREMFNFSSHRFINEFGTHDFKVKMDNLRKATIPTIPSVPDQEEVPPLSAKKTTRKKKVEVSQDVE